MSTTDTTLPGAGAGAAQQGETAQPELLKNAGVAPPQGDAGAEGADQPHESQDDPDKGLSDDQKAIRKLQRRIDRLTAKRGGTERENELLRQQIDALQRQQTTASQQGEESEGQGDRDKPKGRQVTEADIDRIASVRAADLHKQQTLGKRVNQVLAAGAKLEGFAAAVDAVAEVAPFADRQGRPTPFIEAVLDADDPAALLKHLGENPDEADDFADLTPAQLGRRLQKLEDRLKAGAKQQTSAAPKPLKPVAGNGAGSNEPDPADTDRWNTWRNKQVAARAGR